MTHDRRARPLEVESQKKMTDRTMKSYFSKSLGLVLCLCLQASMAQEPSSSTANPGQATSRRTPTTRSHVVGTASWYGSYFHGRPTASGEIYNMYALTAAHLTLPLGSYVRVTNLRNGKSTIVRINDRGPYVAGRIIDLSYGAARLLDMQTQGVQRVLIEVVRPQIVAVNARSSADHTPSRQLSRELLSRDYISPSRPRHYPVLCTSESCYCPLASVESAKSIQC